jgi:hypothetical protein
MSFRYGTTLARSAVVCVIAASALGMASARRAAADDAPRASIVLDGQAGRSYVDPVHYPGQDVWLRARLTRAVNGPLPTGSVTFYDGSKVLGTMSIQGCMEADCTSGEVAAYQPTWPRMPGTHPLTAVYNGDAYYASSVSPVWDYYVLAPTPMPTPLPEP